VKILKILLDIDGTILNENQDIHPRTQELIDKHDVTLFSSNYDELWSLAEHLGIPAVHKDSKDIPEADILIDDYAADIVKDPDVKVKRYYHSVDEFFENELE